MTAFQQIGQAREMWKLMLPTVPPPTDTTLFRWLTAFGIADFEHALGRVDWRYKGENLAEVDPEKVHRFITSTLCWFRDRRQTEQEQRRTQ